MKKETIEELGALVGKTITVSLIWIALIFLYKADSFEKGKDAGIVIGKLQTYEKHISPDRAYSLCIEGVNLEELK